MTTPLPPLQPPDWWLQPAQQSTYPRLEQMAIDVLSVKIMFAELERVFSCMPKTITQERARLQGNTVETECVTYWMRSQLTAEVEINTDALIEAMAENAVSL